MNAFQYDAFQSGAFQEEVLAGHFAFQPCAFQFDAFQVDLCQDEEVILSGGGRVRKEPQNKKHSKQEVKTHLPYKGHPWIDGPIRRYIEEVEPEIVEAVIEVVAKTVEERTIQNKDVEAAQAEKALRERLLSQQLAWKEMYAQLIRLEYERREQEYEDAQIAMLLFDM